ncbi:MAG: glycosyltransferase family 4 protein [Candidatus Aminicenantes bacterium]|nr:glycosyltransferase family 4 protein [Candidatus Aminicenantes bacterium]
MKNILFVSHSVELNGAEIMLLQTIERLDQTRFRTTLLIPGPGPLETEADKLGIEIIIVPMKWWLSERARLWRQPFAWIWNTKSVLTIRKIIRKKEIDLVFTNSAVVFSGALAARMCHRPHIWILHEILKGDNIQFWCFLGSRVLVKFITGISCRVIVNSLATQAPLGDHSKIRLVYNGIPLTKDQDQICSETRDELGLKKSDTILGMVGRVCPEKGQSKVVEAFAQLKNHFPALKLLMVGEIKDKKYFLGIEKRKNELSLNEDVIFTGRLDNILDVIRTMDILIVASRIESFGRVIIEAMSVNTPVVAVRSGGIPEIIEDGTNGFLVPSDDPMDMISVIRPLLESRKKTAAAVLSAKSAVEKRFDINIQVNKITSLIEECIDQ